MLSTAVPLLSALLGSGPSGVEGSRREDALRLIAALGPSHPEIVHRIWWSTEDQYRASGLPEEIHVFMRERMLANHPLGRPHGAKGDFRRTAPRNWPRPGCPLWCSTGRWRAPATSPRWLPS